MKKKIKVAVIGGGNGSAVVTVALKQHLNKFDISAIVSMSDSGGSSGRLRREFDTLPTGDIMRTILSLSKYDYLMLRQIFYGNRFLDAGKLNDHNLGNLFLVLAEKYGGNFIQALSALEQGVEAVGRVYPVTLDQTDLCVELTNGKIVKTEAKIDVPQYNRAWKIKEAWLEPAGCIFMGAKKAIEQADYIILAPGSLYTSVIAALLPKGVKSAIARSSAKLIYVCGDAYRLDGETGPEKLSDIIGDLEEYLPRSLDLVIYNNAPVSRRQKITWKKHKWSAFEFDQENLGDKKIISRPYRRDDGGLCAIKLGHILKNILK
ncbi:MAG: 2-phospho-L-lactate transferase CofD family protein [Candidatus Magasanikbacteria bacterium]